MPSIGFEPWPPNITMPVGRPRVEAEAAALRGAVDARSAVERRAQDHARGQRGCARRRARPRAPARTALRVPQTKCWAWPGSIQKSGGWSARSVSTVHERARPPALSRALSYSARLKFGISDTTRSGSVAQPMLLQQPHQRRMARGGSAPCSSFNSCARPERPAALRGACCRAPPARSRWRAGSCLADRAPRPDCTSRTCQAGRRSRSTACSASADARCPPPALKYKRSMVVKGVTAGGPRRNAGGWDASMKAR